MGVHGHHHNKNGHSTSPLARFLGSSTAATLELAVFHPVDTVAKRIMTTPERLLTTNQSLPLKLKHLKTVVFKDKINAPIFTKYISLFPGIKYGVTYKVSQSFCTYGCQPFVYDFINKNHQEEMRRLFGDKHAKGATYALAGALMGIGEVVLLPMDTLKIIAQTNHYTLQHRTVLEIIQQEGFKLYRGAAWTMMRNVPGSFALFGGSGAVKMYGFKLEEYNKATVAQDLVASAVGASCSLAISSPFDVIKARVQRRSLEHEFQPGRVIFRDLLRKEGVCGLFKGLTTKMMVVGPKLVFSFTIYQQVMRAADYHISFYHSTLPSRLPAPGLHSTNPHASPIAVSRATKHSRLADDEQEEVASA